MKTWPHVCVAGLPNVDKGATIAMILANPPLKLNDALRHVMSPFLTVSSFEYAGRQAVPSARSPRADSRPESTPKPPGGPRHPRRAEASVAPWTPPSARFVPQYHPTPVKHDGVHGASKHAISFECVTQCVIDQSPSPLRSLFLHDSRGGGEVEISSNPTCHRVQFVQGRPRSASSTVIN